jgi:hypothetical protein
MTAIYPRTANDGRAMGKRRNDLGYFVNMIPAHGARQLQTVWVWEININSGKRHLLKL